MSALWRIYWLVSLFFGLIGTVCLLVLLRQASHDVGRELDAAQAMVTYLSEVAERDPAALQAELTDNLRHVRVRWLEPGQMSELQNGRSWLDYQIYPAELAEPVTLPLPARNWKISAIWCCEATGGPAIFGWIGTPPTAWTPGVMVA